jgi:hypothetical protein
VAQSPARTAGPDDNLQVMIRPFDSGGSWVAPHSKPLGKGLFELRDVPSGVRIFYVTAPGRRLILLDGIVKKRQGIPARTLDRLRRFQADVAECAGR